MKPNTRICLKDYPEITGIFEGITEHGVFIRWDANGQPFCYTNVDETMKSILPIKSN